MFPRIKHSVIKGHQYDYLQIIESYREGRKVRQKVLANLGRIDELVDSGKLDRLVAGLSQYSVAWRGYKAFLEGRIDGCVTKTWGPALVFERLWEKQGMPEILGKLSRDRKFGFDPERVAFALALQRLCEPGSDLQGSEWVRDVEGLPEIALHQMYRTVGWLSEVRDELERDLFFRDRDLFTQELDLVFLDTTGTYVYRDEETEFCKRGFSRDHRPDLPQMVLCVAVDRRGWPIAWEVYPGNTADKAAFVKVIEILRSRFKIRRVIVVADRGMISKDTIELLTKDADAPFDYILGCRMRKDPDVMDLLTMTTEFDEIAPGLSVAERTLSGKRYIVCYNEEEAKKDALAREAILAGLRKKLESGEAKSLVGNTGYRRFLKGEKGSWRINEGVAKDDAIFDGTFVLRTNTDLPAAEVAKTYKGLWRVERTFREQKSTLELRPLFHHRDDTRIGHIAASFLALRLEVDLQRRMEEKKSDASWPNLMRDLRRVKAVHLEMENKSFTIRTDLPPIASEVFEALGMRPPPRMSQFQRECSAKLSGESEFTP
jgi:hypothetical protein